MPQIGNSLREKIMKKHICALTIAGFDGSGGAGIQADLKTFSALGCYGTSVLTSLPVQNTSGVKNIYDIDIKCIEEQCHAIFEDINIDFVKIGMLQRTDIIETIAKILKKYKPQNIVLDPVMVAKSGDRLLDKNAISALKTEIFPLATIITPNIPEAQELLSRKISTDEEIEQAGQELLSLGPQSVVIKGGHKTSPTSKDLLITKDKNIFWLSTPRIKTNNTHGTGCTFSSAIASYLGHGLGIELAVENAKKYITGALKAGANYLVGSGHGPVHHFYNINNNKSNWL